MQYHFIRLITLILLFFTSSCSFISSHLEKSILNAATKHCGRDINNCQIHLEKVLDIEWDSMFIFSEYTFAEDVSEYWKITFDFAMVKDSHDRLVLVLDGKVIYSEEFSWRHSKIQFPYLKNPIINTKLGFKVERRDSKINLVQIVC